jgi:hypothetical protein
MGEFGDEGERFGESGWHDDFVAQAFSLPAADRA